MRNSGREGVVYFGKKSYNWYIDYENTEESMETKFKVIMKKDRKVLEDFILFSQRVNSPMVKTKMAIISIGFVMIGVLDI